MAGWPATAGGWAVVGGWVQGGVKGWFRSMQSPADRLRDGVALMRPAEALAFLCGTWCGYRKHEKTGGRGWLPVSISKSAAILRFLEVYPFGC